MRATRDEIFVDVVERLSMTFGPGGNIVSQQVDGSVQVGAARARPRSSNPGVRLRRPLVLNAPFALSTPG